MPATLERPATKLVLSAARMKKAFATLRLACASKSSVTVLTHVLFSSEGGTVFAQTCDGTVWCRMPVGEGSVEKPFTVPMRVLSELLSLLDSDAEVSLSPVGGTPSVAVEGPRLRLQLLGGYEEDFPEFVPAPRGPDATVPYDAYLTSALRAAQFCSSDSHRQVLTGILHDFLPDGLRMVATDTHRLIVLRSSAQDMVSPFAFVMPAQVVALLATLRIGKDDPIGFTVEGGFAWLRAGEASVRVNLLAGTYPNWDRVIPNELTSPTYALDPAALAKALRRTLIVARDNAFRVRFRFHDAGLTVKGRSEEKGEYEETTSWNSRAMRHGKETHDLEIAFNGKHVLDALAACGPKIVAEGTESNRPFLFRTEGGEVVVCIMPMALA